RENAQRAAGLMGYGYAAIAATMPAIEEFAGIGDYFDQPIRTCSSGMQMRVAFSVATAFRPDILIVDEALAVGDASFKARCYERIAGFRRSGSTLVLVSHSMEDIVKHCTRALLVHRGRLARIGSPREVANLYLDLMASRPETAGTMERVATKLSTETERYGERFGYRAQEHRFGSGGARIIDFVLSEDGVEYPAMIKADRTFSVRMSVRFDRNVRRPVFGILVKTIDGLFLYGTNSELSNCGAPIPPLVHAGAVVECEFEIPAAINSGDYLLSLGISERLESSELEALDRRYDSILMNVFHASGFWGLADMKASFQTIRIDDPSGGGSRPARDSATLVRG
ncbi:MAG TPA: Wzt carbohydrate-binding domain-containing protein, partial [Casimicrobiaceae bacterium]